MSDIEICGTACVPAVAGGEPDVAGEDSDFEIVGTRAAADIDAVQARSKARKARGRGAAIRRPPAVTGALFAAWLVCDFSVQSHRWYHQLVPADYDHADWWPVSGNHIVGLLFCFYSLRATSDSDDPQTIAIHRTIRKQQAKVLGFVDYCVHSRFVLRRLLLVTVTRLRV